MDSGTSKDVYYKIQSGTAGGYQETCYKGTVTCNDSVPTYSNLTEVGGTWSTYGDGNARDWVKVLLLDSCNGTWPTSVIYSDQGPPPNTVYPSGTTINPGDDFESWCKITF